MARTYTPLDAHSIINALVNELSGGNATIQAVDSSTFVSVGETILSTYPHENILNALGKILMGFEIDARPYTSKFLNIRAKSHGIFSNIWKRISFYSKDAVADGSLNTNLFTNLADGFDNNSNPTALGVAQSTASMWVQNQPIPAEFYFGGTSSWQDSITRYENQLQVAFRNEEEFMQFVNGYMTEKRNDIEQQKEAFSRMAVLNYIAGIYDMGADMPASLFNITAEFNAEFGTTYTSEELRTTYFTEMLEFLVSKIDVISGYLENRSVNYHWSVPKAIGGITYYIKRHTPKANQKMLMLNEFWANAKARVLPAIFNPQNLSIDNFESVSFWQNENDPSAISVTPAIPDTTDPTEQKAGDAVALDYVLGVLFDENALMVDFQLEDVATTPLEARKHYRTTWFTFRRNIINDFTQKAVLFYMEDPTEEVEP